MLNKLTAFLRRYGLVQPGERILCAVSGGADSMALLYAMVLLQERLGITVEAVHFNHHLRGAESDRDEAFVRDFCGKHQIPLHVGAAQVKPDKKGLENAARVARYSYFETLGEKIATAHTADDNAETVLLHLVRGTGLKGLGGIAPVRGRIIRPLLGITRQDVLAFLEEYSIPFVYDSSNGSDDFLRNRLRREVMPVLRRENPALGVNWSEMALSLREDEAALEKLSAGECSVTVLRQMDSALRVRALTRLLESCGVKEPSRKHIGLAEQLVWAENPSAWAVFPGGVRLQRSYDRLEKGELSALWEGLEVLEFGTFRIPELGLTVSVRPAEDTVQGKEKLVVNGTFPIRLRPRQTGDAMRLPGGSKSVKKLLIDRKIPAGQRHRLPVAEDAGGILGVAGLGCCEVRRATVLPAIELAFRWEP